MKKKLILLLSIIVSTTFCKQIEKKRDNHVLLSINLKELGFWWYEPILKKTIVKKLSDTTNIELFLKDYRGNLDFKIYNLKHYLVQSGKYANALDVFKCYVTAFNYKLEGKIKIKTYYQPLPNGQWLYYSKGKVIKKENFELGVIQDLAN